MSQVELHVGPTSDEGRRCIRAEFTTDPYTPVMVRMRIGKRTNALSATFQCALDTCSVDGLDLLPDEVRFLEQLEDAANAHYNKYTINKEAA